MKQLILPFACVTLLACGSATQNATIFSEESQVIICTDSLITTAKNINISELTEDFSIVYLEDSGETPLDLNWCYFSDSYICVKQTSGAVKLYDKAGKFINDIGSRGISQGEYLSVSDVLVDEQEGLVYITPYAGSGILKYSIAGEFLEEIELGEKLYKASLFKHGDASVSLVHLSFEDEDSKFSLANIPTKGDKSISYLKVPTLVAKLRGKHDIETGYSINIWSHRNSSDFAFMVGGTDTLYHYNGKENSIKPILTLEMNKELRLDYYLMYNELPNHYLITLAGMYGRQYLIEKESLKSYRSAFINDFMGNMLLSTEFQDGYYFSAYKRTKLSSLINKHIKSAESTSGINSILASIDEGLGDGDGYVVMFAKLKADI